MSLLGLDIGITGCKAVAFGLDGATLAQAYREYPAEVWQAVCEVVGRATAGAAHDPVTALSVATHGESVLPVDAAGQPLGRFITALDTRAAEQTRWWQEHVGRERIFQMFQRVPGTKASGSGVGLALVKRIVEGHGGAITVESEGGRGSTFRFAWPDRLPMDPTGLDGGTR